MPVEDPEIVAQSFDFAIARWSRVNVMIWRRSVTAQGLLAAQKNHRRIAAEYESVIALSLAGSALALPDGPA